MNKKHDTYYRVETYVMDGITKFEKFSRFNTVVKL